MSNLQKQTNYLSQIQSKDQPRSQLQRQTKGQLRRTESAPFAKPLLHILDRGEMPGDMVKKTKQLALRGQRDVYITRAEIELKKAMQSLAFMTHSEINSISTLTALSLPKSVTPLFWTINALLQEKYQRLNDNSLIHHRNHDARLLFQQLVRLNLMPWSNLLVDYVRPQDLPDEVLFPIGHPILGRTYRRHPFIARRNHYFPVTDYFSILFKEREQALLSLLGQLGATKITITALPTTAEIDCKASLAAQLHQKAFEYPQRKGCLPTQLDLQQNPWLAGEPTWQAVVRERLNRRALSAQFEFDIDVMGMLKTQIKMIDQLIPGLDSMRLPDNHEDLMLTQVLKTRQVQVEFSEMPQADRSSITT
ncbi:MAG: hypothetical protein WA885_20155 [Phormidesmis sp.]